MSEIFEIGDLVYAEGHEIVWKIIAVSAGGKIIIQDPMNIKRVTYAEPEKLRKYEAKDE